MNITELCELYCVAGGVTAEVVLDSLFEIVENLPPGTRQVIIDQLVLKLGPPPTEDDLTAATNEMDAMKEAIGNTLSNIQGSPIEVVLDTGETIIPAPAGHPEVPKVEAEDEETTEEQSDFFKNLRKQMEGADDDD